MMWRAIVEGIKGREYGGKVAKGAVGACVPGYARSGQKSVIRQPGLKCIAWRQEDLLYPQWDNGILPEWRVP